MAAPHCTWAIDSPVESLYVVATSDGVTLSRSSPIAARYRCIAWPVPVPVCMIFATADVESGDIVAPPMALPDWSAADRDPLLPESDANPPVTEYDNVASLEDAAATRSMTTR